MKKILLVYLAARVLMLALAAANGELPYGEVAKEEWQLSEEGFRFRHVESRLLDPLGRWDGRAYFQIAHLGYDANRDVRSNTAFFPGYAWASRLTWEVVEAFLPRTARDSIDLRFHVMHLTSSAAFLLALWLLHGWLRPRIGDEAATRAGVIAVTAPPAFVFSTMMSESVFLLAIVAAFRLADLGRWGPAMLCAAASATVRSLGAVAALPLALLALEQARWRPLAFGARWLWFLLVPIGILVVLLAMAEGNGHFDAYFHQQRVFFGHDRFPDPAGVLALLDPREKSETSIARDVLQALATALALWGAVRIGKGDLGAQGRTALATLVVALVATPLFSGAVVSMPRYVAVAFPLYGVAALALTGRAFAVAVGASALLQSALWLGWIHGWRVLI